MKHEDRLLPLHTITDPNGDPYISIIEEQETIRLQLHKYDDEFARPIYLIIDKRAVPTLINTLGRVSVRGIKFD